MYEIVDNDEYRDLCFAQSGKKSVKPFELTGKDKLPVAIRDDSGMYYLTKNEYIGFGYWNPSSYDPNVWGCVENKKGKTKALKGEINKHLAYLKAFYF